MTHEPAPAERDARRITHTGPVGRFARLVLAGALGWLAFHLWTARAPIFADVAPTHEPGLWVLLGLMLYTVYYTATLAGWSGRALAAVAALGVLLAVVTLVRDGAWTAPFSWYVWSLTVVGTVFVATALIIAAVMGTPGCEIGILRKLMRRRGGHDDDPLFCLVGLRALDAWESRQPWRREQ